MTILNFMFIRHGHAHTNMEPGLADTGLCLGMTERGIKEVAHAARAIGAAGVKPAHILHSPVVRAHQTAMIIANVLELEQDCLQRHHDLRERGYGSWKGRNPEEMREELIAGEVPDGTEDLEALSARINTVLDDITEKSADGPVIVVSHGGVWQGLHEMFTAEDIPWLDTGDVFAVRLNRVANTLGTTCLFSPSGAHEKPKSVSSQ